MKIGVVSEDMFICKMFDQKYLKGFDFSFFLKKDTGEDFILFLKEHQNIILCLKKKNETLATIKKWSTFHQKGILFFVSSLEIGLTDRINDWLKRKSKRIEVLFFPLLPNFLLTDEGNTFIFGGDIYSPAVKKIRMELAKNAALFLTSRRDAEIVYTAGYHLFLLEKAYLIELEHISKKINTDIELIKRIFNQHFNKPIYDFPHAHLTNKKSIVKIAERIIRKDKFWIIKKLESLLRFTKINTVTVWGKAGQEIIRELFRLPVRKIKFSAINGIYSSAKNTDVILIFSTDEKISSVSLDKLALEVRKKIIIDQTNIFELKEMEIYNWHYISKGRTEG